MPDVIDEEFDAVEIKMKMDNIANFASWDSGDETITFDLEQDSIQAGLYQATVILDDGDLKNEYLLSIFVEGPDLVDDEQ